MKTLLRGIKAVVIATVAILCGNAFGATPVAVWDGDFSNLTKGDITIDLNGGSCSTDKSTISVGSTGAIKLTADPGEGDYNTTMFSGKTASIVIEYSGYSYSSAVPMLEIYMHQSAGNWGVGVASDSANSMKGVWHQPSSTAINRNGDSGSSTTDLTGSTKHLMVLGYDSSSGTTAYVDGVKVFSEGNLKGSGLVPFGFAIGGLYDNVSGIGLASMIISKITIYNKKLTGGDIADANLAEGELPKPRVWNKFDGNFDQIGTQSVTWGDTTASFEDSDDGKAVFTGDTNKYPWYQGMDWGLAESFTVMGSFKVAVANGATNPSGLGGIGWQNDGIMLAASANKVYIVKAGSNINGAASISSEALDVDLTTGYHSYALVATGTKVSAYLDGVKVIDETDMAISLGTWTSRRGNGGILSLPGGTMSGTVRNTDTRCDEYRVYGMALTADQINKILEEEKPAKLADDLLWLPIGDSITEGEQYMGHANQGDVNTRGGYRYQLWREMEEEYGQSTISVGYRTGHQGTVEDPATCHWAWHAAQYGGAIMYDANGSHGAAGLCLDSTLEVAGYPDVITVLIGVNDCSFSGAQVSKVFDSWVAMITKLSAKRPKSTICVSTLLPAGGNRTYIDSFNTLVRNAATAKEAPFNCANVVFADMHQEAFGGTFDSQYFKGDVLHPNENGAKLIGAAFSKYLKDVVADRATHAAELVSIDNGTAGFVTVRFNKALKSVTSATLTITGTDVEDTPVTLTLSNGAIDATNKRLLKFATSNALKGGTYTATITNLAGTDGNGLELPASLTLDDAEFVEILGSGAENNVPATFRSGLTKHGTLAMGDDNFAGNGPGDHFTTASELPQYVKRVAYYMELKRPGQPAQFVWASMDASTGFGSRSINVGIPTSTSSNVKAIVNNLQVYGNRGNFTNSVIDEEGNSSDQGIVEFTPWTWTANDQSGYPADFNGGKFGWNDTLGTSTLKGCMQIAKILRTTDIDKYTKPAAEMLFAYNNFNCATATDIAIGSFSTHRHNSGSDAGVVYDWTDFVSKYAYTKFAADAYEVKSLEIWAEEGEAPQDLYISAGETVTKSASDPLTLPVRGSGRLVLENYLPTDSAILASLQNSTTWTGTVEIKNYTKPDNDNYGIIYFQNYANANSTIALNGVTSTIYTNGSNHPDQTFGSLEIMSGGWTSHNGMYSNNSPLYNCNLKGSGAITINHRGAGTVYFCGDHSNFSGSINFAANADKGVVLAPAGNARTTTGPAARQILIHANTTVRIAGTVNGRVKLAARTNPTYFDVRNYGNDETIVELAGIDGNNAYPINGTITSSPKVVLSGDVTFSNGFSGSSLTWSEVSGTGNFTVSKSSDGNQNYVISTLKGYTGAITAKSNTTLTIGSVVTTLTEAPAGTTTIVNFGSECVKDKVTITGLTVKLADGIDITEDVVIEKIATGITIVKKAPAYPVYVDPTDPKQTEAFDTWKTTHAEALASATELQAKESYFLNCAPTAEAIETAKANFKVSITIAADGTITVSAPDGYNVTPVIKGKANLSDTEWTENCENAKFFKAFIELK